jgi:hypothetical protein
MENVVEHAVLPKRLYNALQEIASCERVRKTSFNFRITSELLERGLVIEEIDHSTNIKIPVKFLMLSQTGKSHLEK